ncbi:hypothetical protein EG856_00595 [Mycoplasmopsis phocirhinis]|uniref:Uncharacterized protein n=1 Tax=Mycoplasmopsis phocirhinis TaxID=142650 RepID=A0A4P6MRI6_9BACT|nr:hypothetical protein [Mycoplasmopsis phocirhinis]QBF34431.1 hypothetical protein EG856_00595 [Mycoplasmopsis phocirhinis]
MSIKYSVILNKKDSFVGIEYSDNSIKIILPWTLTGDIEHIQLDNKLSPQIINKTKLMLDLLININSKSIKMSGTNIGVNLNSLDAISASFWILKQNIQSIYSLLQQDYTKSNVNQSGKINWKRQ